MTNRELDALMWLLLNDKPLDLLKCRYVDGDVQPHGGYPAGHISPDLFSTDTSAAILVLEKMIESDFVFYSNIRGKDDWWVVFVGDELRGESTADSFSQAICRAAYNAVEKSND